MKLNLWPFIFLFLCMENSSIKFVTTMNQTDKNILLGKFEPSSHPDYVAVSSPYTYKQGIYLHKKVYDAFRKMHEAAKNDGINLQIISATRSFDRQKQIWENKWNGITPVEGQNLSRTCPDPVQRASKILSYSSMPGTSRHHWGTDIDINSVVPGYFQKGKGLKEYQWLTENASRFGFCQPYKMKGTERKSGYEDEPWHWSFVSLAIKFTQDYVQTVTYDDLQNFLGSETAPQLDVIKNYVLGIHPDCLHR